MTNRNQDLRKGEASVGHGLVELDAIDRKIIAELQRDGRLTNVELARRSGLSAPPCLRRVRRLEKRGILTGFRAEIDAQKLGWSLSWYALVGLESQNARALEAFENALAAWPEVRECHMIRGGGDFLIRFAARDAAHQNDLTNRLTDMKNVVRVQTLQTIRTTLNRAGVPI